MNDIRLKPFTIQMLTIAVCVLLAWRWNFTTTNYMLLLILCMMLQIHSIILMTWQAVKRIAEPETEGPPPSSKERM